MIDLAAELLNETGQQVEYHEREIARLQQLRASLEAFIEQPEQESLTAAPAASVGSPAPAPSEAVRSGAASDPAPAAVPSPPGGGSPAIQQPVAADSAQRSGADPGMDAVSRSVPPPASTRKPPRVSCPDCDAEVRPGGLGAHRRIKHGHRAAPKSTAHQCPECSDTLPTSRGLSIHRRFKHDVRGRDARSAVKAVQPMVVDEALRPDPAIFPDAPASAYVEDGVLVIGDQGWTAEQWKGRDGRAYRAQRASKRPRSAANPRSTPPLKLPPRLDQASGE